MKNTILIIATLITSSIFFSCEQELSVDFKESGHIYFSYADNFKAGSTIAELDSVTYSFANSDKSKDTIWADIILMGERSEVDRKIKLEVLQDSCTAIEGTDFEKLQDYYSLDANKGKSKVPIVLYNDAIKNVSSKNIILKIIDSEDLKLAFEDKSLLKISYSAFYFRPWWWHIVFQTSLGDFHWMKLDKVYELMGTTDIDPYDAMYSEYICNLVKKYFDKNEVIDPITGERVEC